MMLFVLKLYSILLLCYAKRGTPEGPQTYTQGVYISFFMKHTPVSHVIKVITTRKKVDVGLLFRVDIYSSKGARGIEDHYLLRNSFIGQ